MNVVNAIHKLRQMPGDGVLLVKGPDGRWTRAVDVQCSGGDAIYAPTSMCIEGVRYVREVEAEPEPRAARDPWADEGQSDARELARERR